MSITKYLDTAPLADIEKYISHVDLGKEAVPFVGSPRKHPYDEEKLLLILEPFTARTVFYEFLLEDICYVEDMASVGTASGQNLSMVKIWVRRGSLGMQYQPFEVDTTLKYYRDSDVLQEALQKR